MTDIQKLKALAEAYINDPAGSTGSDSDFRSAANPAAVLELIAEIDYLQLEMSGVERAKQDLAEILDCADEPRWKWLYCNASSLKAERDQLKTGNIDLHATLQAAKGEIERLKVMTREVKP